MVCLRRQLGVAPTEQLPTCVNQGIIPTLKDMADASERGDEAIEVREGLGEVEGEERAHCLGVIQGREVR